MAHLTGINEVENITERLSVTSRGGGIEISLDKLGYVGGKMTAYQNYLGGGILGRVCSDCNVKNWQDSDKLNEIAEELRQHYHSLTNPDEEEWESMSYGQNQNLQCSAY